MAIYPPEPRFPCSMSDPPRQRFPQRHDYSINDPEREANNMAHKIDRPPRPAESARSHYDGIEPVFPQKSLEQTDKIEITTFGDTTKRYITDAISTNTAFVNLAENETANKANQKEQRQIKVTLKKYGIEINEWKLYVSQWA
jgi:hypothetical protein